MLHNDRKLRKSLKLPRTKIETDSYIAVQLLRQKRALNFNSLKYMAEQVEGSFSFTVLDERDQLYFVKGDNPLCICHFPKARLYLYASTEAVLADALMQVPYLLGEMEEIRLDGGELLMIAPNGKQKRAVFQYDDPMAFCGSGYRGWPYRRSRNRNQNSYIAALKTVAGAYGYSSEQIDCLLEEGFEPEEIEEYLYCGEV